MTFDRNPLHRTLCMKPDACSECDRIAALTSAPAEPCRTCGASEPYTGTCGTSDSDTRALCKRATQPAAGTIDAREQAEKFLDRGLADVQDEGGVNTYYSKEAVLECIAAALASREEAPATPKAEPVGVKLFKTTVLGVGPFCIEFADGEIISTRSETRQKRIAAALTQPTTVQQEEKKGGA